MTRPTILFNNVSKIYSLSHQKTETLKDRLTRSLFGGIRNVRNESTKEEFYALRDVSFEIQPGESVGIIGPNGSGKSTSLKILAGVTKPSSGRFELNGRLGSLIEVGAGFHPEMTGRENVFMNGSILGMSKKEVQRKFDSIVDFSGIEKFIDTPVKHYSSGMYIRLGFAVAIHNEPDIMLVDEVLAVGDLGFQKKCFEKMREFKDGGRTFILVSHTMSQIQMMCSRAILLNKGECVADGNPNDITGQYIDLSNPGMKPTPVEKKEDQIKEEPPMTIEDLRLMLPDGSSSHRIDINQPITLEFDFRSHINLNNPLCVILIKRAGMRIYSSNTRILQLDLGIFPSQGTVRCEIPAISLIPNEYDVEIYVARDPGVDIYGHALFDRFFSIIPPPDINQLGCYFSSEPIERDVLFARGQWSVKP